KIQAYKTTAEWIMRIVNHSTKLQQHPFFQGVFILHNDASWRVPLHQHHSGKHREKKILFHGRLFRKTTTDEEIDYNKCDPDDNEHTSLQQKSVGTVEKAADRQQTDQCQSEIQD